MAFLQLVVVLHQSSIHLFCHLNLKSSMVFSLLHLSLLAFSIFYWKYLFSNIPTLVALTPKCHLQTKMLHQSLFQTFFLSSHSNDDDDSNYKIIINSKILYTAPPSCLSNSSCVSCYLSATSFAYFSFTSFYNLFLSTIFCVFFTLAIFYNLSSMFFSLMLQNTLQTQNANTLLRNLNNKKKFNDHSYFLLFVLGQPAILILDHHFFKQPIRFMMTSLLYIHVETINILFTYQWSKCIAPFFIHPYIIVTTCPFIFHVFYHVY